MSFGHITDFRVGWIPETFAGLGTAQYAFAHIDVDLYQSTLDSCQYFYPRLTPGGVLLFDEYGLSAAHGEKVAVDEYFADKPERPIAFPTGRAMVVLHGIPAALRPRGAGQGPGDREGHLPEVVALLTSETAPSASA